MKRVNLKDNERRFIICVMILILISFSIIFIFVKKEYQNSNISIIMEQSIDDNDEINDDSDIDLNNLPYIRLNYYNSENGNRYGYVLTNNGDLYKYSFNEETVLYPDTFYFSINQTLYLDNVKEYVLKVSDSDLKLLKKYTSILSKTYNTNDIVVDTFGNSISVTDYINEDIYVLKNSEGIINTNTNTNNILNILNKYNIKL